MQTELSMPDKVRLDKIHETFDALTREVESQWMEKSHLSVPDIDVRATARRIVSLIEADIEIASTRPEDHLDRAKKNLTALFEEKADRIADEGMSPNEAAAFLRMSRGTLNKLLGTGELKFHTWKVGTHWRISRADVEAHWDLLMRDRDPYKKELVRLSEEARLYDAPKS